MTIRVRPVSDQDIEGIREVAVRSWRDTYDGILPSEVIEKF
ncbi:hypothetical protein [Melghirimyces profundicolus]|nr:hypothetical protein [Melghirimyces profundicolus]